MTYNTSANTHLSSLAPIPSMLFYSHPDHVLDFSGLWYEANAVLEDDDKNPELYQGNAFNCLQLSNSTIRTLSYRVPYPIDPFPLTYLLPHFFFFIFVV